MNLQKAKNNSTPENIVDQCLSVILKVLKTKNLFALLLVGSFARGEGIAYQDNGETVFISDIEFLLIAKEEHYQHLRGINTQEIQKRLQRSGYNIDVSIGVTTISHLKKLKPHIFTLEVKNYGKVIWGNPDMLSFIPNYTETDIDPLDGFVLLNNRIVEQLILGKKISNNEEIRQYEIDKGYIQAVNSILGIKGSYKSLYPEKRSAFLNLLEKNRNLKETLANFTPRILEAFDSVITYEPKSCSSEQALKKYEELKALYERLYSYEKKTVGNPTIIESIKGWIKVVLKKQLSYFSFSDLVCHLFTRSPQFLIYEQAVDEYFSETQNLKKAEDIIHKWKAVIK
jgi:hypothetical protein